VSEKLFTGEQLDLETGNYYLRARYYDQSVGRFTQMDTWAGRPGEPITLNKYLYGNADPANYIDPTGNFSLGSFGAANNISSVLMNIQVDAGTSILDSMLSSDSSANGPSAMALGIISLGGGGLKLLKLLSKKGRNFLKSKKLQGCKTQCIGKLRGKDYEEYLTKVLGGKGSFSKGGRDFDGGSGNHWWEAKSGRYWQDHAKTEKGLLKFKSDMGARKRIADDHGASYHIYSNSPIPSNVKTWLTKKGIKYTEMLD